MSRASSATNGAEAPAPSWFRSDLQGLRGCAILLVVGYHAHVAPPGSFVAFDAFFVLSGYVVAGMLHRTAANTGSVTLWPFFVRRFWRLFPAFAIMTSLTLGLCTLLLSPVLEQGTAVRSALAAIGLHANYTIPQISGDYFGPKAAENPFLHTWSLSLEEQAYAIYAVTVVIWWRLGRSPRSMIAFLTISGTISLSIGIWSAISPEIGFIPGQLGGYYGPGGRYFEFVAGALVAYARVAGVSPTEIGNRLSALRVRNVASLTAVVILVLCIVLFSSDNRYPSHLTLLPVACVCVLLATGSGTTGTTTVERGLQASFLTRCGDISYSWYLWHWPLIVLSRQLEFDSAIVVLVAIVSVAPAVLSYKILERGVTGTHYASALPSPARGERPLHRALMFITVPLIVICVVVTLQHFNYFSHNVERYRDAAQPQVGTQCIDLQLADGCTLRIGKAGPLFALGDSNAEHWSTALLRVAEDLDLSLNASFRPGCPPFELPRSSQMYSESCQAFFAENLEYLRRATPGVVVLGFSSQYFDDPQFARLGVPSDLTSEEFQKSLLSSVESIEQLGHAVVLAQPIFPFLHGADYALSRCSTLSMIADHCAAAPVSATTAKLQAEPLSRIVLWVSDETDAVVFDPMPALCDVQCTTEVDGDIAYLDSSHVTRHGSLLAWPALWTAIRGAARLGSE